MPIRATLFLLLTAVALPLAASRFSDFMIEVSLVDRTGAAIGTTRTFAIPSGALAHLFFPSALLASRFDEAVARFRIVSGSGAVAPFASVIENASSNAVFLNGGFPPGTSTVSGGASFFRELLRSPAASQEPPP